MRQTTVQPSSSEVEHMLATQADIVVEACVAKISSDSDVFDLDALDDGEKLIWQCGFTAETTFHCIYVDCLG